ncbi:class I SAM-dependent methyltransferase [Fluviicola taffensis]|uniref:Methyltransferase type 11 n=1 Tax=Fluviicola taffensis (strain DSM 16823 / NCIMB 13979 / RW262) TaxID=755732 RepID=F2IB32_FLUTR|nr:class I SAM-dependent methyltransferase [Fluviicola taffensis]AEA42115.1 Methyltransferase type 11 [Fluviicola taffensis DSM 16823]
MNNDNNIQAVSLFNKLADSYQERFLSVEAYSESFEVLLSLLNQNSTVLDVACGPGNISKFLLNKRIDLQILGIDLAPNMIQWAKKNNPTAQFKVHNALQLELIPDTFDAIVIGFLFPYLSISQVKECISKARKLINTEGIIYISTMEDRYENSRFRSSSTGEQLLMHYYEASDLIEILEMNEFKVVFEKRQAYSINETESDTDLMLIAQKLS